MVTFRIRVAVLVRRFQGDLMRSLAERVRVSSFPVPMARRWKTSIGANRRRDCHPRCPWLFRKMRSGCSRYRCPVERREDVCHRRMIARYGEVDGVEGDVAVAVRGGHVM